MSAPSSPWKSKIPAWISHPLSDATKDAKVRDTLNLYAQSVAYSRSFIVGGWTMGGLGAAMMGLSIWGWVHILPLKTIQTEIWVADRSTGIIAKPVSLSDAPTQFGPATEQQYLRIYLLAMERWVSEIDQENDHQVKIMSSREQQDRINADRLRPESNARTIGSAGHVQIVNDHYFPQFMDKNSETRHYTIHFTRIVWRGDNQESSEPWTAVVDFQWHPERTMKPADRTDNPGGLVVIAYTSKSDIPDQRRQ